jgi:hypothetical protein
LFLTFQRDYRYIDLSNLTRASSSVWLERLPYKQDVAGSTPVLPIALNSPAEMVIKRGRSSVWLECLTVDQEVASSSLVGPAISPREFIRNKVPTTKRLEVCNS